MLHKAREILVRLRTMLTNAVRAHMAELGTVTAQGTDGLKALKAHFQATHADMPRHAAVALLALIAQADLLSEHVETLEAEILDWHTANDASRRLATIPGVGPITASAIAASVPDAILFRSARQFAAWLLGLKDQKKPKVVAVAQANKNARVAWAILRRNEVYTAPAMGWGVRNAQSWRTDDKPVEPGIRTPQGVKARIVSA